jgi:hypothetical protein
MEKLDYKKISSLTLVVLVAITFTRIWAISLFYIFGTKSEFTQRIINDPWHHYQVGILLTLIALILKRNPKFRILGAVGIGIFLEEWPVFLNDLGLNTNDLYHTKIDFTIIFLIIGFFYILSTILSKKLQRA